MTGMLGGGGAPPPAPMQPQLEKPQVMPIKDPEADKRQELRVLAEQRAGKTTRRNTIIGSDDEGL